MPERTFNYIPPITYPGSITSSTATQIFFYADRNLRITGIKGVCTVVSSAAETLDIKRTPSGSPSDSSAVSVLSAALAVNTGWTANVLTTLTLNSDRSRLTLKRGDCLAVVVSGTMSSLAGGHIFIEVEAD